jgi:hypothetical protein
VTRHPADAAERLLGWSVRMLPARRREWGRAMQAELAAIEPGPARWGFALGCARAALGHPATIAGVAQRLPAAAVVIGAALFAGGIRPASLRREVIAMVAILALVSWLARRGAIFGPAARGRTARVVGAAGFAVIATETLIFIGWARGRGPDGGSATTLVVVWTAMLTVYSIALARLTARRSAVSRRTLVAGAGTGVTAAAAWLAAAALDPAVPTSSGPAVVAIAAGAACAGLASGRPFGRGTQSRIAGLCAAAGGALLIAVMIDGPLRLFSPWVANSAPPASGSVERLVDSIGVWWLGCLLAAALSLAIRSPRPRCVLADQRSTRRTLRS